MNFLQVEVPSTKFHKNPFLASWGDARYGGMDTHTDSHNKAHCRSSQLRKCT